VTRNQAVNRTRVDPRRGTVLIVSMWVILVLVGLVLVFGRSARVDAIASANYASSLQARAVGQGAVVFVRAQFELSATQGASVADVPCEAVQVGGGTFWVVRSDQADDRVHAFGVRDEASRINLNSASVDMLLRLPGMTNELAAAIVDWRDEDSEITPGGAEDEYYLLLPEPYYCKNAPFETIEELLLVKGASWQILHGEDANRNGVLDPNEKDGDESEPADNADGHLDRGLLDYVTVYSVDLNVDADGAARVDVNRAGSQELSDLLRSALSGNRFYGVMDRVRAGRPYRNVLDFYYRSSLDMPEFEKIADKITTRQEERLTGLVNVSTAPREILMCLPGLDASDVNTLLEQRAESSTDLTTLAWAAGALDPEKGTQVGDFLTTRSYQFSADIVSVSADGRAFQRCFVVLDALDGAPRTVRWKSLTHLGWPLDTGIISTLRAGKALP